MYLIQKHTGASTTLFGLPRMYVDAAVTVRRIVLLHTAVLKAWCLKSGGIGARPTANGKGSR